MMAATFTKLRWDTNRYQRVSNELAESIEKAIDRSQKPLDRFKNDKTLKNAVFLCEDDRWTMLLLFLARAGYSSGHNKLFDDFRKIVDAAIVVTTYFP